MQVHDFFVVLDDWLHLKIGLISHHMIYLLELHGRQNFVELFGQVMRLVARQEYSSVPRTLDKCMNYVTIGLDCRKNHSTMFISQLIRSPDRYCSVSNGVFIYSPGILNSKGDILNSVSMLNQMPVHLLRGVTLVNGTEDKSSPLVVPNHVAGDCPLSGLKSLVGQILEAKSGSIVRGCLFGIANPEGDVVQLTS